MYVLEGHGTTTVWAEGHEKISFEWQKHSLFRIPTNYYYQFSNMRGDQPALTMHVTYLPLAMATNPNTKYYFENPLVDLTELYAEDGGFYSREARAVERNGRMQWFGNFFPDLTVWDKLEAYGDRGRMAYTGGIVFPNSAHRPGLMVLPSRRYRAAHRHGPGVTIVGVKDAQGFVIMFPPDGGEPVLATWKEASVFVPPNMWYHMHMNSGASENRQLRLFPARPIMNYTFSDPNYLIPFTEEQPWIRKKFEEELAKNRLTSLMPEEAYTNPDFEWDEEWLKKE